MTGYTDTPLGYQGERGASQFPALTVALELARRGYHVIPIAAADMKLPTQTGARVIAPKEPFFRGGPEHATTDPQQIRQDFERARRWVKEGGYRPDFIGIG